MAKKSKTQKAKASARRAEKKLVAQNEAEVNDDVSSGDNSDVVKPSENNVKASAKDGASKKSANTKKNADSAKNTQTFESKKEPKATPKKKGGIVGFYNDVKAEMKRVTWPTRQDVLQWSGVVVVALLFFGIYVAILDSGIITPLLVAYSGLGA